MLSFALSRTGEPKGNALDRVALREKEYPEIKPWIDSLQCAHALRDTFIVQADGTKAHALYVWAPRKERADIRISDVSAWCVYPGKGFTYSMEYYLSSAGADAISVKLLITVEEKDKAEVFHQAFGENPLGRDVLPKMREDNGRYIYEDMMMVDPKDVDGSAENIAAMVKDAREKVVDVLDV